MTARVEALVKSELLVWARESAGLEVAQAAAKIKVSPATIEAWEAGSLRPSVAQLRKLGTAYKRPLAVFYLPEAPLKFEAMRDFRRLAPDRAQRPSPALQFEIRRARQRREVAVELADLLGEELPRLSIRATPADDPVAVARRLRTVLRIPLVQQFAWSDKYEALNGWRSAVEEVGILVFQCAGVSVEEIRGFSAWAPVLPTVVLNTQDSPRGRLFTLLHEVAHLAIRNGGMCDLHDDSRSQYEADRIEVFCNRVAGATLVPPEALRNDELVRGRQLHPWTPEELRVIADKYSVSVEVALRSLTLIGAASEALYERMRRSFAAAYRDEKSVSGPVPYFRKALGWNGRRFSAMVLEAYDVERITGSDLVDFLGVKIGQVEQLRRALKRATGATAP